MNRLPRTWKFASLPSELCSCLCYSRRGFCLSSRCNALKSRSTISVPTGSKHEDFQPKPLSRPIGLDYPPKPGQNTGVDTRSWRERRLDWFNHDKYLERREQLQNQSSKPYFRDWSNMRFSKGKSFLATPHLFRQDKALYFPNLRGVTLASPRVPKDTTPILKNKVSIVSVVCSQWADRQATSFTSEKQNPGLYEALRGSEALAQFVDINIEENALKAGLVRLFMPSIRKRLPPEMHERFFLIRKGLTEDIRNATGLLNRFVGYVFLIDRECKIRWAGSAIAGEDEKEWLIKGVRKLISQETNDANSAAKPLGQASRNVVEARLAATA